MANPATKDGHIRIANDVWKAWMCSGPLKERVRKAIIWECWGWEDRRKINEPIPITRGIISKLTGIKSKARISELTNELAREKVIIKIVNGSLETPLYWPNQDYESWITDSVSSSNTETRYETVSNDDDVSTTRYESVSSTRYETVPMTRYEIVTPTLQETIKGKETSREGKEAPVGAPPSPDSHALDSLPIYKAYRRTLLNGGHLRESQKRSAYSKMIESKFMENPRYEKMFGTIDLAQCGINAWIKEKQDIWREKNPKESTPSLCWIIQDFIWYFEDMAEAEI